MARRAATHTRRGQRSHCDERRNTIADAMAKTDSFEIECPCCGATLKISPALKAVLSYKEKPKPKTIGDIQEGLSLVKEAQKKREEAFQKSFEQMKSSKDVLSAKFDELLKKAKEEDPTKPPPKPIGLE
jgi:hypothetical protein